MSNVISLPSDPAQLTRELALKCCARPDLLVDAYARLTLPIPLHHAPVPAAALERLTHGE